MRELRSSLREGDRVAARGEDWLVAEVERHGRCTVLSLHGCGPGNAGDDCRLITPFDQPRARGRRPKWRASSRAHAVRTAAAVVLSAHPYASLRATSHARIDLLPWQLAPAMAVIAGHPRLIVADDVGLGKTVQAALVIAELRARGDAARVLVLTPAGLRAQWVAELHDRCGLDPVLVDQARLARDRITLPRDVNPWLLHPLLVTSIDLVRQPEVLGALGGLPIDLLVVDEAHHAAPGTDRGHAVRALAAQALRVLLLTATPHSGHDASYRSLCAIGAFEHEEPVLVFRRTHADVGLALPRRTHALRVSPSETERALFASLRHYSAWLGGSRNADSRVALLTSVLGRRAASGPGALARTLLRRRALLDRAAAIVLQLPLPWDEPDVGDDCVPDHVLGIRLSIDGADERRRLEALIDLAQEAEAGSVSKRAALARLVARVGEPAIVFTEYRDTLDDIRPMLEALGTVVTLHGGLARAEREAAVRSFTHGQARWLLATDAGSEGLNLHARCRVAINLEVPSGPTRFAQRAGRVSRLGQRRTVHVFTLLHADGFEEPALARFEGRRAAIAEALSPDRQPQQALVEGFERAGMREAARLRSLRRLSAPQKPGPMRRDPRRVPCALAGSNRGARAWRLVVSAVARDVSGRVAETAVMGITVAWRQAPSRDWRIARTVLTATLEEVGRTGVFAARAAALQCEREGAFAALRARGRSLLARALTAHRFQPSLFDARAMHEGVRASRRADAAAAWWRARLASIESGRQPVWFDAPVLRAAFTIASGKDEEA